MDVELSQMGNVPFTFSELSSLLSRYSAPKNKAQEMERKGQIVRLKKGLYVANPTNLPLIANHLHGPSYVSQHTALRHYGLIPEHVFAVKSMTTARSVEYTNSIGRFVYTHVADDYYPIGITLQNHGETWYQIATAEKALCDIIVSTARLNLRSLVALREYLEEDLRFDMDCLREMNPDIISSCAAVGKKQPTLLNLCRLIKHE